MIKDIEGLKEHLYRLIRENTDVAVIGLSGGADSTLIATLCANALGKSNVVGVHMPYGEIDVKGTKFNARSVRFARHMGIEEKYIPVTSIANEICAAIDPQFLVVPTKEDAARYHSWHGVLSQLDRGNARARARMAVLYGLAGVLAHEEFKGKRVRVIGTGNLSEDFIGYDTKGGDALADFHPIGRLFKSEVYQLLNHFIEKGVINEEHVDRVPSAGLWDNQTDEGEIGFTYNAMEIEIREMLESDRATLRKDLNLPSGWPDHGHLDDFVYDRHMKNKHKHEAIPSFNVSEFVD